MITDKKRLAEFKDVYIKGTITLENTQYREAVRKLPLINKKIMILQSGFQQLLKIKRRRVEIMEQYPTNEFEDLLSYLRFQQIIKMRQDFRREWKELTEREKVIQEHQTEETKVLKTKQKQKEIELLQQQIDKLKNDV